MCNIFVRNQSDLGKFEIAIFILNYQLQFLFLCDQVLGGESFHNGLKSIATDHYCCCYTMHNSARVTLFCEKPNVTRASIFSKFYYKIMVICGQSLLNAYQWTYYIIILFYWKLINSVKLGLKTCIMWYICKMSQNFPPKATNLAYILQKITKNAKVSLTSNYVLIVNLGMGNKILSINNNCWKCSN